MEIGEVLERQLVGRARSGDDEAFRELVEANHRRVYALALRYTRRHEEADEIAQETFIRAHRALGRFRGQAGFGTWLYRIAVNCCLSRRRRTARRPRTESLDGEGVRPPEDENPSPERKAIGSQTRRLVDRALDGLSRQQRMIFVMRFLKQHTLAEIAEALGCAEGTVKKQLFRATASVRRTLAPLLGREVAG